MMLRAMSFDTGVTKNDLLRLGADKETINVSQCKNQHRIWLYIKKTVQQYDEADFYVNPKTVGQYIIDNNETEIASALKTIHVTEAG